MVYIRVDANSEIGSGHLMRTIAIAKEMEKRGQMVIFVCADNGPREYLESQGLYMINLMGDWKDMTIESSKMLLIVADEPKEPVLLIDTYSVSKTYVNIMSMFSKVCYLGSKKENLGNLSLLVNYSADIDEAFYEETYPGVKKLLGVEYSILRPEFIGFERNPENYEPRVLITTGNTDNLGMELAILDRMCDDGLVMLPGDEDAEVQFEVVVGSMSKDRDEIFDKYGNCPNVNLHEKVEDMAELMKKCPIAITAGGTTMNELAAMETAMICFAIAEDQPKDCKVFARDDAVLYVGNAMEDKESVVRDVTLGLCSLLMDEKTRTEIATNARKLIDGEGVTKICDAIEELV